MKLNKVQIDSYRENGYLIIESLFSKLEIDRLKKASEGFKDLKSLPNVICEENGDIRSVFAPQLHNVLYDKLYKEKRLVNKARQLISDKIYLYQYKLNNKKALTGKSWEWHQDFPYWHIDDGVEQPNMISVMILFQDTNSFQGPLLLLTGSHESGVVTFHPKQHLENKELDIINSLNADLKYTIQKDLLNDYFINNNIIEGIGPIGTCIFFHPNLFHASNCNMSPFDRNTAIITYNDIENLPKQEEGKRPDYICSREYNPIIV
jgi:ectoine hydroxylase